MGPLVQTPSLESADPLYLSGNLNPTIRPRAHRPVRLLYQQRRVRPRRTCAGSFRSARSVVLEHAADRPVTAAPVLGQSQHPTLNPLKANNVICVAYQSSFALIWLRTTNDSPSHLPNVLAQQKVMAYFMEECDASTRKDAQRLSIIPEILCTISQE